MYDIAKVVHLTAMVLWMGGMFLAPILISVVFKMSDRKSAAKELRSWYLRLFSPAMIVLWIAGIYIMTVGGWFNQPWMIFKLVLLLLLSGLHGALSGQMRRLAEDDTFVPWLHLSRIWIAILIVLFLIISAAVFKF